MAQSNETQRLLGALLQPLPRDAVRRHPYSGVDYVSSHWVISRLNEVFGPLNWDMHYDEVKVIPAAPSSDPAQGKRPAARTTIYVAGRLVVRGELGICARHDIGVGICADDKAEAFETGIKAAYTDALKRCARTFGPSLGLALYEKERTTVGVASAAQVLLEEIAALDSADACDAWIQRRREAAEALEDQDRTVLRDAFRKRRNGFASASPSKSLVEVVVEAIAATKSVAELAAVRKQYANQVRSLPAANLDEIKTAANEQERHLLEAE